MRKDEGEKMSHGQAEAAWEGFAGEEWHRKFAGTRRCVVVML